VRINLTPCTCATRRVLLLPCVPITYPHRRPQNHRWNNRLDAADRSVPHRDRGCGPHLRILDSGPSDSTASGSATQLHYARMVVSCLSATRYRCVPLVNLSTLRPWHLLHSTPTAASYFLHTIVFLYSRDYFCKRLSFKFLFGAVSREIAVILSVYCSTQKVVSARRGVALSGARILPNFRCSTH
jgi:hypothetical protein